MEKDKKIGVKDYLRKKGVLPPVDLGVMFYFTSTREAVSEIQEIGIWTQYITHGWRGNDKIPIEIQNYTFKSAPWNISIWDGDIVSQESSLASGFGDLWTGTTFCSKDTAALHLKRDEELERVEKKYHTVEEGTVIERAEFSTFSNKFNVVLKTSYALTKEEWNTLCTIMEVSCEGSEPGWWQFRSGRSEEFDRSGTLKWEVCDKLFDLGLLKDDDMDWNLTYYITDFGKQIYEKGKE